MTDPVPARSRSTIAAPPGRATTALPVLRHRLHARGTPMPSPARSRALSSLALLSVAALAALLTFGLAALAAPPAALAQKKILNIAAKEPDSLDPHSSILGQTQAIK